MIPLPTPKMTNTVKMRKPKRMKDSTVNKRLAALDGWKETENKNWESSDGVVCILPPDYCGSPYGLSNLMMNLSLKKKKEAARLILTWLEK